MTDNTSPFKLKNPTEYHLLATQQQAQQSNTNTGLFNVMDDQHLDFSDCYTQQFLSPSSNSPPLQDFDDVDSLSTGLPSSAMGNLMIVPDQHHNQQQQQQQQQILFFPSQFSQPDNTEEESPSDYSSSLDIFSNNSQPSSYLYNHQRHNSISNDLFVGSPIIYNTNRLSSSFDQQHQPFSAPAHMGYELMGHMGGLAAFHHQPVDSHSLTATGSRSLEEYESIQINQQLISEKKRRRRESHNAVERRRRENINERIQELGTMLPETMLEELASVNMNGNNNNKPNKGAILRKSVDHIRILQQEVTNHRQRIYELETQLASLSAK
ncbi:hypothetical protein PS15p_204697 [Mucor circinelloides]